MPHVPFPMSPLFTLYTCWKCPLSLPCIHAKNVPSPYPVYMIKMSPLYMLKMSPLYMLKMSPLCT
jgi:hypothetical protein